MFNENGFLVSKNQRILADKKRKKYVSNLAGKMNAVYSVPQPAREASASDAIALDYALLTELYHALSQEIADYDFDTKQIDIINRVKAFKLHVLKKISLQDHFNKAIFEADFLIVAKVLCARWNITLLSSDLSDLPAQVVSPETQETHETQEKQTTQETQNRP